MSMGGRIGVMRRSVFLLSIAAAAMLLVPAEAFAKGSTLRFDEATYAPDAHAVGHAVVETWPGTGEPGEGPFIVYLVGGFQPLWHGHLPEDAIPVGRLRIGEPVGNDEYRVTAAFDVPRVPEQVSDHLVYLGVRDPPHRSGTLTRADDGGAYGTPGPNPVRGAQGETRLRVW